jgi:hypothetical protein
MMEKTGSLLLSSDEYFQIKTGIIPERIQQNWGLSLEELRVIISNQQFELMDANPTVLQSGL